MKTVELKVVLSNPNGDVVTSYPAFLAEEAIEQFRSYVADGYAARIETVVTE